MARIVISEFIDERAVAQLAERHDVLYDPALVDDPAASAAAAASADALIARNRTQVRGELLAALARCRVVGRLGVGLDNIDVAGCEARGIVVIPATGANAVSVAEYVVTAALMLVRGAYAASADVVPGAGRALRSGRPRAARQDARHRRLRSIGRVTARLAQGSGSRSRPRRDVDASDAAYAEAGVRASTFDGWSRPPTSSACTCRSSRRRATFSMPRASRR